MPLPNGELSSGMEWATISNFFLPIFLKLFLNSPTLSKIAKASIAFGCSVIVSTGAVYFGDTTLAKMHDLGSVRSVIFTIIVGAISCYTAHMGLWTHTEPASPSERADTNITEQQIQSDRMNEVITPSLQPLSK